MAAGEQQVPLYKVLVNLTKSFGTVKCGGFLVRLVDPHHFCQLSETDMKACLTSNGSLSDEIAVDDGLAPTLLNLSHAFENC